MELRFYWTADGCFRWSRHSHTVWNTRMFHCIPQNRKPESSLHPRKPFLTCSITPDIWTWTYHIQKLRQSISALCVKWV